MGEEGMGGFRSVVAFAAAVAPLFSILVLVF